MLSTDFLSVNIRPQGAELTSIFHKPSQTEHLWQGDPAVWGWHAPNLFPVVGGCLNNQILVDSKAYPMGRHGFARQSVFELVEQTDTRARFVLTDSEESRQSYPFRFLFGVDYTLTENTLAVTYRVRNQDDKTVFFSVGAHPAFNVPFESGKEYEDYWLEFEQEEALMTHLLSKDGYFTGETQPIPLQGNRLPLTKHLFDQDALVIKDLRSRAVSIRSRNHERAVTVRFDGFPYLGLWAKPGAPFVCIEPWLGCADTVGAPVEFAQKELIQSVGIGEVFEATFTVTVD
jgi:galactose mutarotase-like enzyme